MWQEEVLQGETGISVMIATSSVRQPDAGAAGTASGRTRALEASDRTALREGVRSTISIGAAVRASVVRTKHTTRLHKDRTEVALAAQDPSEDEL